MGQKFASIFPGIRMSMLYFTICVLAAHLPFLASLNLVRPYNTAGVGLRILSPRSLYG